PAPRIGSVFNDPFWHFILGSVSLRSPSQTMKRSLRQTLADSHIAAVTIALLLLWSLDNAFRALWEPLSRAMSFLFTAVAILDIPYFSSTITIQDRLSLFILGTHLYWALVNLFAAWLLSNWVYRSGPLSSLSRYSKNISGSKHV
ncbi:MAG: hypothetical protein ACRD4F_11425, partial [Candidatus Angelobacter sp.]